MGRPKSRRFMLLNLLSYPAHKTRACSCHVSCDPTQDHAYVPSTCSRRSPSCGSSFRHSSKPEAALELVKVLEGRTSLNRSHRSRGSGGLRWTYPIFCFVSLMCLKETQEILRDRSSYQSLRLTISVTGIVINIRRITPSWKTVVMPVGKSYRAYTTRDTSIGLDPIASIL